MGVISDSIEAFTKDNGDYFFDGHWRLFANGAKMEMSGLMFGAPRDPWARAKKGLEHRRIGLQLALAQFDADKRRLGRATKQAQAGLCDPPSDQELSDLEALRNRIPELKAGIAEAEKLVTDLEPAVLRQGREVKAAREKVLLERRQQAGDAAAARLAAIADV